jgi:hypothetical protein
MGYFFPRYQLCINTYITTFWATFSQIHLVTMAFYILHMNVCNQSDDKTEDEACLLKKTVRQNF